MVKGRNVLLRPSDSAQGPMDAGAAAIPRSTMAAAPTAKPVRNRWTDR